MIAIGSDQAAFDMKNIVVQHLKDNGFEVRDLGSYSKESVDYPEYGEKVGEEVASGKADFGIVICGTGIGISMAAGKVPGIRAAVCTNEYMAQMARQHNDANVLALGARVIGIGTALSIVDAFFKYGFLGDRHQRRVNMINDIDKKHKK